MASLCPGSAGVCRPASPGLPGCGAGSVAGGGEPAPRHSRRMPARIRFRKGVVAALRSGCCHRAGCRSPVRSALCGPAAAPGPAADLRASCCPPAAAGFPSRGAVLSELAILYRRTSAPERFRRPGEARGRGRRRPRAWPGAR